jgi:hypothetical protein
MPTMVIVTPKKTAKYDCDQSLAPRSKCHAHLARIARQPTTAKAPNTRLSAMNTREKGANCGTGLTTATSNVCAQARRVSVAKRGNPGTRSVCRVSAWSSLLGVWSASVSLSAVPRPPQHAAAPVPSLH